MRIQELDEVPPAGIRLGLGEQTLVQAHLGGDGLMRADPADGALDLDRIGARRAALGVGNDRREHGGDLAGRVLLGAGAFDDEAGLEAHLVAGAEAAVRLPLWRVQPEVALGRHLHEVLGLDPQLGAEREPAYPQLRFVRVGGGLAGFAVVGGAKHLGVVRQLELERLQHREGARRLRLQVGAQGLVEHRVVDPGVLLAGTGGLDHRADALGREAAAAQADQRRHARVVPAADVLLLDELAQLALAGDDVVQVEPAEFDLLRQRAGQQAEVGQVVQQPVVEGALVLELQRADAVGDALQRVLDRMREGVHRVDAPCAAGGVMLRVLDAVERRVAQVDVGRGHVDLGTQHHGAVGMLAVAHLAQAREVLGRRAVAEGAVDAGLAEIAAVLTHLFGRLLVDIGQAGLDQCLGRPVHEVEIAAGLVEVVAPAPAQPLHHLLDGVDVLQLLLLGVGVVEAQVAGAAVVACQAEVQADALGMADVQIAIGLGREAGADARGVERPGRVVGGVTGRAGKVAAGKGASVEIVLDALAQEVGRRGGRRGVGVHRGF
mmetsp:Transcript_5508/g.13223  ORF Transcript_5508/g.13223 Transcript_5508/m.13223 type:complete len:548 (-) Transcript_5508:1450-3093(-)